MEYGYQIYDQNKQLYNVSSTVMESPWLPRWILWASRAVSRRGGCLDAADRLHAWVTENPLFEDVVHEQHWVPSCPWLQGDDPETKRLNEIGELVREDSKVS